jgi:hypothetical protein
LLRRILAESEVRLSGREALKGALRESKIFRQQGFRRMADPIGDAERAEFREIAVIKDKNKMAGRVAQAFQHMRVAARKIPDIARPEVIRFRAALRVDDGRTHLAVGHESPFGRGRVPVQLSHHTGLHAHRDAGDGSRYWQLGDGGFLAIAAAHCSAL